MKHSKSSLFLMELIIALLFFSVSSTVCIRLFVKAHALSAETVDQNYAINYAQNMAELFTGCDGDLQAMQALLSGSMLSQDGNYLVLIENGYHILLARSGDLSPGSMVSADIVVGRAVTFQETISEDVTSLFSDEQEEPYYSLHVDLHIHRVK